MPVIRAKVTGHADAEKENGLSADDHSNVHGRTNRQIETKPIVVSQTKRFSPISRLRAGPSVPLCKKFELQRKMMTDLSSALDTEDISDLRILANRLSPIARAIISQKPEEEPEGPGRLTFHRKIAVRIFDFFEEHEALYDKGSSRSVFTVLLRTDSRSSNDTLESVLYVLAALFVLAGPLIFMRRRALNLLHCVYKMTPTRRTNRISSLRILTWRCLVWSFSRMVDWDLFGETFWQDALEIVECYLFPNDIVGLVAYLIDRQGSLHSKDYRFPGIRQAVLVVHALTVRPKNHSRTIGFDILRHLLLGRSEGTATAVHYSTLTLDCFLQIEAILKTAPLKSARPPPTGRTALRVLSLDEVNANYAPLVLTWHVFLSVEVCEAIQFLHHLEVMRFTDDILDMWRVLIRAAGSGPSCSDTVCDAHISLISVLGKKGSDSLHLDIREISVHAIQAATELWSVTVEELANTSLSLVVEMILREVFERRDTCVTFLAPTETAFNNLVRDIVFCDPQQALSAIETVRIDDDRRGFIQLQTWSDLVHFSVLPELVASGEETRLSVEDLITFLQFPYRMRLRDIDGYTSLLWDELLKKTFPVAEARDELPKVIGFMKDMDQEIRAQEHEE